MKQQQIKKIQKIDNNNYNEIQENIKNEEKSSNLCLQFCLYLHFRLLPFILFSQIICFVIKVFF